MGLFFKKLIPVKPINKSRIKFTNLNDLYNQERIDFAKSVGRFMSRPNYGDQTKYKRLYVLDFKGDLLASQATGLEHEVTSVIDTARAGEGGDEVLIRLESPGGAAYAYGHAASQIDRLKRAGIKTTVAVDRIAASGGYMMAAVADRIISAPMAIIGSIGVVAEVPNFHNVLKNLGIEYKQYTAGEFKRTISQFGEITEEGEEKFVNDLHRMHEIFKKHIETYRPGIDMDNVATGEHWSALDAIKHSLVDKIETSEDFLYGKIKEGYIAIQLAYSPPRPSFLQVLAGNTSIIGKIIDQIFFKIFEYRVMLGK